MNTYLITSMATMKPYNRGKWWITGDNYGDATIQAETPKKALEKFAEKVNNEHLATVISKNAIRNAEPMYRDTEIGDVVQVGYVVTGKDLFDKGDYSGYSEQYFDIWCEIIKVENAF